MKFWVPREPIFPQIMTVFGGGFGLVFAKSTLKRCIKNVPVAFLDVISLPCLDIVAIRAGTWSGQFSTFCPVLGLNCSWVFRACFVCFWALLWLRARFCAHSGSWAVGAEMGTRKWCQKDTAPTAHRQFSASPGPKTRPDNFQNGIIFGWKTGPETGPKIGPENGPRFGPSYCALTRGGRNRAQKAGPKLDPRFGPKNSAKLAKKRKTQHQLPACTVGVQSVRLFSGSFFGSDFGTGKQTKTTL